MSDLPFILPGQVRPVQASLDGKMIWLYGEPKIGKTTFCSEIGNTWFLATEKGQDFVACREPTQFDNWKAFRTWVEQMYKHRPKEFGDGQKIEWLAIDTVDKLYRFCSDAVCKEMGIEDPSEMAHGKAWSRLRNEFHKVMNALRSLPYGLICISHETRREATIRNQKVQRIQPNVGAAGYDWLLGASDLILRAFAQDVPEKVNGKVTGRFINQRIMKLHPDSSMVAGGRMSKILPPTLPLSAKALLETVSKADVSAGEQADGAASPSQTVPADGPSDAPQE